MYVLVETNNYATKNKLQKEVFDFLRGEERKTFKGKQEVKDYIVTLHCRIAEMNERHPRCKPVKLSEGVFKEFDGSEDLQIAIWDVIIMMFYFGIGVVK
jgi:hypothetical protein